MPLFHGRWNIRHLRQFERKYGNPANNGLDFAGFSVLNDQLVKFNLSFVKPGKLLRILADHYFPVVPVIDIRMRVGSLSLLMAADNGGAVGL
jgi:hypothetical protein